MAGKPAIVTIVVKEIVNIQGCIDGLDVVGHAIILVNDLPRYLVSTQIPLQPNKETPPKSVDVYVDGVKIGHGTVSTTLHFEAINREAVAKVIENAIDGEEDKGTKEERIDYSN